MSEQDFWKIVRKYNTLMKAAIRGPDCIDPNMCHGDCCSIKIDVPKILAIEYIKKGYAKKSDFIRSNVFSFQLRFDDKTGKCFLFDKEINGCSVHNSGIKPPQCWIYPTNFSNSENKEINCKRIDGWKIINPIKAKDAEILLQKFISICENEAIKEIENINNRINENDLKKEVKCFAPSRLGGFKDTWNDIKVLSAEGISLQMKKFCSEYNNKCKIIKSDFIECVSICDEVAEKLIEFLIKKLYIYIQKEEPDTEGFYPLYKLFKFAENIDN